ncbi:hypothetical protein MRX96_009782 [Rhipicephalus microplus]
MPTPVGCEKFIAGAQSFTRRSPRMLFKPSETLHQTKSSIKLIPLITVFLGFCSTTSFGGGHSTHSTRAVMSRRFKTGSVYLIKSLHAVPSPPKKRRGGGNSWKGSSGGGGGGWKGGGGWSAGGGGRLGHGWWEWLVEDRGVVAGTWVAEEQAGRLEVAVLEVVEAATEEAGVAVVAPVTASSSSKTRTLLLRDGDSGGGVADVEIQGGYGGGGGGGADYDISDGGPWWSR